FSRPAPVPALDPSSYRAAQNQAPVLRDASRDAYHDPGRDLPAVTPQRPAQVAPQAMAGPSTSLTAGYQPPAPARIPQAAPSRTARPVPQARPVKAPPKAQRPSDPLPER